MCEMNPKQTDADFLCLIEYLQLQKPLEVTI